MSIKLLLSFSDLQIFCILLNYLDLIFGLFSSLSPAAHTGMQNTSLSMTFTFPSHIVQLICAYFWFDDKNMKLCTIVDLYKVVNLSYGPPLKKPVWRPFARCLSMSQNITIIYKLHQIKLKSIFSNSCKCDSTFQVSHDDLLKFKTKLNGGKFQN